MCRAFFLTSAPPLSNPQNAPYFSMRRLANYWNTETSPLPRRTTSGVPSTRSTTVVGSWPQLPPSMTRSTWRPSRSLIAFASVKGRSSPGSQSVELGMGSPNAAKIASASEVSGTRKPIVLRRGDCKRRETLWVAFKVKIWGPGVKDLRSVVGYGRYGTVFRGVGARPRADYRRWQFNVGFRII